jgi:hypothetical protein
MPLGHRELVRLKMNVEEVNNFNPPQGIDITWHDYDYYQGEVTASITGLEWSPPNDDTYFVYKEEVNHMLSDLKIAQDGIKSSKYPIPFIRTVDTCKSFLEDTEYDYLISKGKVNTETFYENRKAYKLETVGFVI